MSKVKIILACMAAGAIAGMLLAPEKGSDLRKRISKKGKDYSDNLKGNVNGFLDDVSDRLDTVQTKTDEMISNGKAKVEALKLS